MMFSLPTVTKVNVEPMLGSLLQSLTKASNVAIHANVIEVELRCLLFSGVRLGHIIHGKDFLLTELCVVVKVDLRVKAYHCEQDGWLRLRFDWEATWARGNIPERLICVLNILKFDS
jgi:hypothetical protein